LRVGSWCRGTRCFTSYVTGRFARCGSAGNDRTRWCRRCFGSNWCFGSGCNNSRSLNNRDLNNGSDRLLSNRSFDDGCRCFDDGNRRNIYFDYRYFDSRCFLDWFSGLLCRGLLGGLFLFNRSNLAYEASGFSFALEHRHECFNQS
jgi:hypothetical protein